MTNKEAIEILSRPFHMTKVPKDILIAHQMAVKLLNQEPCEDCVSKANALHIGKNEYLRGWHDALCKALSEKYSIHCKEGNFNVIQEETITGLGLSMDCAIGKDVESYMGTLPPVQPTCKKGHWIFAYGNRKDGDNTEKCSNCKSYWKQAILYDSETGDFLRQRLNYCPNCGAEMSEDEE